MGCLFITLVFFLFSFPWSVMTFFQNHYLYHRRVDRQVMPYLDTLVSHDPLLRRGDVGLDSLDGYNPYDPDYAYLKTDPSGTDSSVPTPPASVPAAGPVALPGGGDGRGCAGWHVRGRCRMIFDLIQTSKFLYGGAFAIVGKEGVVGDAKMKSPITGLRAGDSVDLPEWSIGFRRHAIRMAPTHAHDYERNDAEMPTDVCAVQVDGAAKGEVYLARVREHQKKALLNLIPTRYRIARMRCAGVTYSVYPAAPPELPQGWCVAYCVYVGDIQVAEVRVPSYVLNNLYRYRIFIGDAPGTVDGDDLAVAAVVIGCYLHLMDYRGEVVTDASYALERPRITDKRLLSRFDPEFAPRIAP